MGIDHALHILLEAEEIEADPQAVGYDPGWGKHWGPARYKPDYWNYGPKGYYSPPMPLPRVLYHATPYADQIVRDQMFQTARSLGYETFGGHGTYVSCTTLVNARHYAEALRDVVRAIQGEYTWEDRYKLGTKWGILPEKVNGLASMIERWAQDYPESYSEARMLLEFFGHMNNYGGNFPILFGVKNLVQSMGGKKLSDVGVLKCTMAKPLAFHSGVNVSNPEKELVGNYTYNEHENEWRIYDPSTITDIERVE